MIGFLSAALVHGRPIVLKAARLFDGRSGAIQRPGLVVVNGTRIQAVGPGAAIPADAEIHDLGDATLLPGFMDAHTHLRDDPAPDPRVGRVEDMQKTVPEHALEAAVVARKTLMAGFTTVRKLGAREFVDLGLRNAIARGLTPGPRMLVSLSASEPPEATATAPMASASDCWRWPALHRRSAMGPTPCAPPCAGT